MMTNPVVAFPIAFIVGSVILIIVSVLTIKYGKRSHFTKKILTFYIVFLFINSIFMIILLLFHFKINSIIFLLIAVLYIPLGIIFRFRI